MSTMGNMKALGGIPPGMPDLVRRALQSVTSAAHTYLASVTGWNIQVWEWSLGGEASEQNYTVEHREKRDLSKTIRVNRVTCECTVPIELLIYHKNKLLHVIPEGQAYAAETQGMFIKGGGDITVVAVKPKENFEVLLNLWGEEF